MKAHHTHPSFALAALLFTTLLLGAVTARGQGTAFTYQGVLNQGGAPANGLYDLRFTTYDAASAGSPAGAPVDANDVSVSNGLFAVTLDFGANVFTGGSRWLEIGVKSNGAAGTHVPLAPRQPLTPSPYAIFAGGAQTSLAVAMGAVNSGSIASGAVNSGAIADGSIQTNDLSLPLLNGTFWRLDGNSGPGNFLGSTDNRPLEFRVNGASALRLTPSPVSPSVIGGYSSNSVRAGIYGATISGGGEPDYPNRIEASSSAIGGGMGNTNSSANSFIGGGAVNLIQGGGTGGSSLIGGGQFNVIGSNGLLSVIAGGNASVISNGAQFSTISGGDRHLIETNSRGAAIGGGRFNLAAGSFTTVAGGERNTAANSYSTVGGGLRNTAAGGSFSTAGGTVAGGNDNFAGTNNSFVGGGSFNTNISRGAFIGGGEANGIFNSSEHAAIGGGFQNRIQTNSDYSVVGGGQLNVIHNGAAASAIAGGRGNAIQTTANDSVISGGRQNVIQTNATFAAIGGGIGNSAQAGAAFIGGGSYNTNTGGGAVIGGGIANRADNFDAVIAGGAGNVNAGYRAFIGSGEGNVISSSGSYAAIPGGLANSAAGLSSFAAGRRAKANHDGAFVWADATDADFISTGTNQFLIRASGGVGINHNNPTGAALAVGGAVNVEGVVSANAMSVASVTASQVVTPEISAPGAQSLELRVNGARALRLEPNATSPNLLGGFSGNIISNGVAGGFIGGGGSGFSLNVVGGNFGSVLGGRANSAIGEFSTASGGNFNRVFGWGSTIGGGSGNGIGADAVAGAICGGSQNFITFNQIGAFIGGGTNNVVESSSATIAGGGANLIETNADLSAIGGGQGNLIVAPRSVIAGGHYNRAGNVTNSPWNGYAAVGGGNGNVASGSFSVVGGGYDNLASGHGAVVGGGGVLSIGEFGSLASFGNVARGTSATIPGGAGNVADGDFSLAAGVYAGALHARTFVWSSSGVGFGQFESTGPGQFLINATGGVGIGTPNPQAPLHLFSANNPTVMRIQSAGTPGFGRLEFLSNPQGDFNEWRPSYIESSDAGGFTGGLRFVVNGTGAGNKFAELETMRIQNGRVGIGSTAPSQLLQVGNATCNGSLWNNASDRNLKENFKAVDAQAVLERVAALPLSEWNYKATPGESHVGPMAQDFKAAFGLGADDKSIATVDADGVALAAIQGLNQKLEETRKENSELKARLEKLEQLLAKPAGE